MLNELGWEPLESRRLRTRLKLLEQLRIDIFNRFKNSWSQNMRNDEKQL